MKKLVVSLDTYSWIKYMAGLINRDDSEYEVIILLQDNRSILEYEKLCDSAVYEQRRYDLQRIAKKLDIKKISNFQFSSLSNIELIISKLQFYLLMGNYSEIYCKDIKILVNILKSITKTMDIPCFVFGDTKNIKNDKVIELNKKEIDNKLSLSKLIVGKSDLDDVRLYPIVEKFYRV